MYGWDKDCLILIPFRLPQISCFTLSLKCFSSDSDNCPNVGIRPLLQFPHPLRAGPFLLTLLFFPLVPSSYQVLLGSIYSFLPVRYSCPLSAGVLQEILCLKLYSWCIHGEMYSTSTYSSPIFCILFYGHNCHSLKSSFLRAHDYEFGENEIIRVCECKLESDHFSFQNFLLICSYANSPLALRFLVGWHHSGWHTFYSRNCQLYTSLLHWIKGKTEKYRPLCTCHF